MARAPKTRIVLHLEGAGWATLTLAVAEAEYVLDGVSYLTDVLGDLVDLALCVLENRDAHCIFEGEPVEWILSVSPLKQQGWIKVQLTEDGETKLGEACEARSFAMAVRREAARILHEYGLEGYQELWVRYPFPEQQFQQLQTALSR